MEIPKNKEENADVNSLMKLANVYFIGDGVEENEEKAFELFLQVYELGHNDSEVLLRLGQCYFNGYGVDRNAARGVEFLKEASDLGSVDASFFLGKIYADGEEIEVDLAQARSYYELAAQAGDAPALVELGRLYKNGQGVARDREKAAALFRQAADMENAEGLKELADCYKEGCGVCESREESNRLLMKAAELGNAAAQYGVGCNYYTGDTVRADVEEAEKWLRTSAEQGHEEAVGMLEHLLCEQGRIEEMLTFLEEQAKKGCLFALFRLGVRYWTGDQVEKNLEYAMDCWEEGSARGSAECSRNLGICYQGDEIERNAEASILWFQRAAEQGNAESLRHLGLAYSKAGTAEYDPGRAAEFYKRAVEEGDAPAAMFLSFMYRDDGALGANSKLAYYYAEKAYELGYDGGAYLTGVHLFYGNGVEQDRVEGIRRLNLARKMGHPSAENALVDAYAALEPEHPLAEEAFQFFQEQAESGNGAALGILGQRSFHEGDYEKAVGYWERAAEQGNTMAEQTLGKIYLQGQGKIPPDKVRGAAYMKSAADKGDVVAQIFTAFCYEKGDGVEVDNETAFQYMTNASDAGDVSAHFFLGEYYEKGVGTQPNPQKAESLFRMVAVSNEAMDSMREMTQRALAGRYLEEGRFEDLYALHMELGDSPSAEVACFLGKAYQYGCGTEKSVDAARSLYTLAVRLGHEEAATLLEALDLSDENTEEVGETTEIIQGGEKETGTTVASKTVKGKGPWLAIALLMIALGILALVIKGSGNSVQRASEYEEVGTLWETTTESDAEDVFGETILIRDVDDDYVNLREGPGTEYDIITTLPNGSRAQLGEGVWDDRWTYVMCEGNVGWVHSDFVHDLRGVIRNNSNTGCNVRQGPGTNYDIIGYLYNGEYVTAYDAYDDDGWYCIEYDGGVGWISGGFWHDGGLYVYNTNYDGANFRAEPSEESEILAYITNYETVIPVDGLDEGEWVHVRYAGMTGWVYRDFIYYSGSR